MPEFAASQHDRQGATAAWRPPVSLGPGRTLDGNVRSGMGARFGHDFSRVRVHSDEKSATFVLRGAVLAVGAPGGLSEREADRTAVAAGGLAVGEPRETPPPATVGAQLARFGDGSPLPDWLRSRFETQLGDDLSGVRVHTGASADANARDIGARAYTVGGDVAFAAGEYRPDTPAGLGLLAHELTHVVQQRRGATLVQRGPGGVETTEVSPAIENLLSSKQIGYSREVVFDLLDEQGNAVLRGRVDYFMRDPRNGQLVGLEVKGLDLEALTKNQKIYVPLFEGGGAKIRIVSNQGGTKLAAGTVEQIRGESFLRVGQGNLKDFGAAIEEITTGKGVKFSWRDKERLRFFRTEEEFDEFLKTKGISRTRVRPPRGGGGTGGKGGGSGEGKGAKGAESKGAESKGSKAGQGERAAETGSTEGKAAEAARDERKAAEAERAAQAESKLNLGSVREWGKVGPLDAALFYLQIHEADFAALEEVSKRAEIARNLLARVDSFERGARRLQQAVETQANAEAGLPGYPLMKPTGKNLVVSAAELQDVERYWDAAARIANDALSASAELGRIIAGWDDAVKQAYGTSDFTRKSAIEAVQELDLRFSKGGSGFRAFLVDAQNTAWRVQQWARWKQWNAQDILGKPVPESFTPYIPADY
jgi:hypothetical protein